MLSNILFTGCAAELWSVAGKNPKRLSRNVRVCYVEIR